MALITRNSKTERFYVAPTKVNVRFSCAAMAILCGTYAFGLGLNQGPLLGLFQGLFFVVLQILVGWLIGMRVFHPEWRSRQTKLFYAGLVGAIVGYFLVLFVLHRQEDRAKERGDQIFDALIAYSAVEGKNPRSLEELVPEYLDSLPQVRGTWEGGEQDFFYWSSQDKDLCVVDFDILRRGSWSRSAQTSWANREWGFWDRLAKKLPPINPIEAVSETTGS